jgi:hypothetical protein
MGVYVGREHFRRALLLFGPEGSGAATSTTTCCCSRSSPSRPTAARRPARWQGMVMLSEPGANGVWGVGLYENAYVKDRGTWKISKLHFYVTALTDYDAGFTRSALRMDGPSALYPPDRPPTEVYRAYPSAYIPPFSYVHPVTGKPLTDIPEPADTVARPQP